MESKSSGTDPSLLLGHRQRATVLSHGNFLLGRSDEREAAVVVVFQNEPLGPLSGGLAKQVIVRLERLDDSITFFVGAAVSLVERIQDGLPDPRADFVLFACAITTGCGRCGRGIRFRCRDVRSALAGRRSDSILVAATSVRLMLWRWINRVAATAQGDYAEYQNAGNTVHTFERSRDEFRLQMRRCDTLPGPRQT